MQDKIEEELESFKIVKYRINEEGFHYCFESYSSFDEIEDKQFHHLRKQYLEASKELETYIKEKILYLENKINNNPLN
jgi:hypothetical protein